MNKLQQLCKMIFILAGCCLCLCITLDVWCLTSQEEDDIVKKVTSGLIESENLYRALAIKRIIEAAPLPEDGFPDSFVYIIIIKAPAGSINIMVANAVAARFPCIANRIRDAIKMHNTNKNDICLPRSLNGEL